MSRIVVALGGNALGNTPTEQREKVKHAAKALVPLIIEGNDLVVCHGNGPQVGMINLVFEKGHDASISPAMPLAECTAMSQGYIGYHLQNAIDAELEAHGFTETPVVTMLTQVVVDENDPAFDNPTKPIGSYYDKETAEAIAEETGYQFVEDSGRGYRRVVASPAPIGIYEDMTLKTLFNDREVIIAGGGGGIPVVKREYGYEGVDAVVDKDLASAKLAELIDAEYLFILTAVEKVAINFGTPDQQDLDTLTTEEVRRYIGENQFAPGSMLPKVEAAMNFVESKKGSHAVITSLESAAAALRGETGTTIVA